MTNRVLAVFFVSTSMLLSGCVQTLGYFTSYRGDPVFAGKFVAGNWYQDVQARKGTLIQSDLEKGLASFTSMDISGNRIAYDTQLNWDTHTEYYYELRLTSVDGQHEEVLLRNKYGFIPQWSPDGKFLLINVGASRDTYIMNPDTKELWKLSVPSHSRIKDTGNFFWMKNGRQFIFQVGLNDLKNKSGLFRMNLDGTGLEELTAAPYSIGWVDISPDENRVVMEIFDRLFELDLQTKDLRRLWKTNEIMHSPQYSPDGNWVLYYKTGFLAGPNDALFFRNIKSGRKIPTGIKRLRQVHWWHPPTSEPAVDCDPIVRNLLKGREVDIKTLQDELNKSLPEEIKAKH